MGPINYLFFLFFLAAPDIQRDLSMAKAFIVLKDPDKALDLLKKDLNKPMEDRLQLEVILNLSKSYIDSSQPLEALSLLQQIIALQPLNPSDKEQIFSLISAAFLKLNDPKRAVIYADLSEQERCALNSDKGMGRCPPTDLPDNQDDSQLFQFKSTLLDKPETDVSPFRQAIDSQTLAMNLAIALPLINTYKDDSYLQVLNAQKNVQQSLKKFKILMREQQKLLTPDCETQGYEEVSRAFQEGLNLALLAENLLQSKESTFAKIIPLQKHAIEKFEASRKAFINLQNHAAAQQSSSSSEQESSDLNSLKRMMQDEKKSSLKQIPKETDKVIW